MGQIAHACSGNKVPLLLQAKDAFVLTLEALSQEAVPNRSRDIRSNSPNFFASGYSSVMECQPLQEPQPDFVSSPTRHTHIAALYASLRHQLIGHITSVEEAISAAEHVQHHHRLSRAHHLARLSSSVSVSSEFSSDEKVGNDARSRLRKERIQRLRVNGWKVTKESHGFKGQRYYEQVRQRAEEDLEDQRALLTGC